jgi:thioredoxin-dependent peroxiredoxin
MTHARLSAFLVAAVVFPCSLARSQVTSTTPAGPQPDVGPKVGEMAPDFEFTGITRYGKLAVSQKLSDLRGQTVVLAFFPKARTRG